MGQVSVTLNGRTYRLRCGDGEEQRLRELADHVGQRVEKLAQQFGQYGDERLLLMAALLITDDMLDLKARLDATTEANEIAVDAATELAPPLDHDALEPPEAVTMAANSPEVVEAIEPPAAAAAPELDTPRLRPTLRRGSLEARLAQARVGVPPKTGT